MPASAAASLQCLDDSLAQHVISMASLDSCKALSETCSRFCNLVRSSRSVTLWLRETHEAGATLQRLARMPAGRGYQRVHHIAFAGYTDGYAGDVPNWWRLCSLMWAAVQRWPGVERITIDPRWHVDEDDFGSGTIEAELVGQLRGYLTGALAPLMQATGLRSLTLDNVVGNDSLLALQLLTQLTGLTLSAFSAGGPCLAVGDPPVAPLAGMTRLRELCLYNNGFPMWLWNDEGEGEADLPLVLPPHLTLLEALLPRCSPGMFWRHVTACRQLVRLTLHAEPICDAADHPSWVLHQLASSLVGLQYLEVRGFVSNSPAILPEVLGLLADTEAGQQQQQQGWDWADMAAPGLEDETRSSNVVVPPPNMGALTALRTLQIDHGYQFRCCSPHHWHALAGCCGLRQLHLIQAWVAPPAGVKFTGVTDLKLMIDAPALSATAAVLGAFPALQQLLLKLDLPCPEARAQAEQQHPQQQEQQQQAEEVIELDSDGMSEQEAQPAHHQQQQAGQPHEQPEQAVVLGSLVHANIIITCDEEASLPISPAPWCALWRAMPALQALELRWPPGLDLLPQLPPLAAFKGLTSLTLYSWHYRFKQHVSLQALLRLLQGCSRLQELKLRVDVGNQEHAAGVSGTSIAYPRNVSGGSGHNHGGPEGSTPGSSSGDSVSRDQLVLVMQAALPSLRRLMQGKEGQVAPLAAGTLAALRPGLQVGTAWFGY